MIKEKDLYEVTAWNYNPDPDFHLADIKEALESVIQGNDYLAGVQYEKISAGSVFSAKEYDCIKLYNPQHQTDYFYYCILLSKERNADVVSVYLAGKSTQMKMDDYLKNTKAFDGTISRSIGAGILKGGSFGVGMAVGGAAAGLTKAGIRGISKGIAALTRDKEALAREESWYNEATELLAVTFNPE